MSERTPAAAKTSSKRWLAGAAGLAVLSVAAYFYWRPGWDVFRVWFAAGAWWCIARWSHERGFIRGWNASRRKQP